MWPDIDFPEKSIQALQKIEQRKNEKLWISSLSSHFHYLSFIKFERYEEASQRNRNSMENLDLEKKIRKNRAENLETERSGTLEIAWKIFS